MKKKITTYTFMWYGTDIKIDDFNKGLIVLITLAGLPLFLMGYGTYHLVRMLGRKANKYFPMKEKEEEQDEETYY